MKIRVNVVMGGPSAEHEISLRSGREVLRHLDPARYTSRAVLITHDRRAYCTEAGAPVPDLHDLEHPGGSRLLKGAFRLSDAGGIWQDCDVAFLALHGEFGEDGVFQGYLDSIGIPYQGSGVYASAVAMNKITSRILFERHGMTTPPGTILDSKDIDSCVDQIGGKHGFPCFVKCPQSGSSRLMGRATDAASLRSLLRELAPHSRQLLVETAISGVEFSCGVLEEPDGSVHVLPPVEIRPKASAYFDFTAKYTDHASEEIVPAPRPREILQRIQEIALKAHDATGCRGISRTDIIWSGDDFYVLEINNLPGLTPNSLVPKAYESQGRSYADLLDTLITTALKKKA